jgi:hypothetical protein
MTTHTTSCSICRGLASVQCSRCKRALCLEHRPEDGRLCIDCELEFGHRVHRGEKVLAAVAFAVLTILGVLGLYQLKVAGYLEGRGSGTGVDGVVMVVLLLIVVAAATRGVIGLRLKVLRSRFLRG